MRCTWLADVARAAGLVVVEEPGWRGRGKEFPDLPIEGVVGHHTASAAGKNCPSINTLVNGRPDLAGPLAQYGLCRDGVVHVIADGVANHAGDGSHPGIDLGNKDSIGIEAENNGVGEAWGEQQMDSYVRLVAAILDHIERGPERFCTHYEWTTRKIDAAGPWIGGGDWYDGGTVAAQSSADRFRARVEDAMAGLTPAQEAKLDKVLDLCDNILRPKLDATYVQVAADDHDDTLAGRVFALTEEDDERRARHERDADPHHRVDPDGGRDDDSRGAT